MGGVSVAALDRDVAALEQATTQLNESLATLDAATAKRTGDETLSGIKTFTDNVVVQADIVVSGTVDGVNVSELSAAVSALTTSVGNLTNNPNSFSSFVSSSGVMEGAMLCWSTYVMLAHQTDNLLCPLQPRIEVTRESRGWMLAGSTISFAMQVRYLTDGTTDSSTFFKLVEGAAPVNIVVYGSGHSFLANRMRLTYRDHSNAVQGCDIIVGMAEQQYDLQLGIIVGGASGTASRRELTMDILVNGVPTPCGTVPLIVENDSPLPISLQASGKMHYMSTVQYRYNIVT